MQAKVPAERDVEALLCGCGTTSNRSWPNESWIIQVNNPWLNYGWLWSHKKLPQVNNTLYWAKEFFYNDSFSVEELNEIGETEFESRLVLIQPWERG